MRSGQRPSTSSSCARGTPKISKCSADHALLQPDAPDSGYRNPSQEEAEAIDARHLLHLVAGLDLEDDGTTRGLLDVEKAS